MFSLCTVVHWHSQPLACSCMCLLRDIARAAATKGLHSAALAGGCVAMPAPLPGMWGHREYGQHSQEEIDKKVPEVRYRYVRHGAINPSYKDAPWNNNWNKPARAQAEHSSGSRPAGSSYDDFEQRVINEAITGSRASGSNESIPYERHDPFQSIGPLTAEESSHLTMEFKIQTSNMGGYAGSTRVKTCTKIEGLVGSPAMILGINELHPTDHKALTDAKIPNSNSDKMWTGVYYGDLGVYGKLGWVRSVFQGWYTQTQSTITIAGDYNIARVDVDIQFKYNDQPNSNTYKLMYILNQMKVNAN